jgi:hypothetical protein
MRGGARSALFVMLMSPKKTGARSAGARTRGQTPLVSNTCVPFQEHTSLNTYPVLKNICPVCWSGIHERTIWLRFLGIIIRLEVSVYNVYSKNQFQTTHAGGGGGNPLVEVTVSSKEENTSDFCPIYVQEFGLSFLSGVGGGKQVE